MKRTIALILGGGQGKRLFPLTMYRSKPAVPIGGKYRLIDIPISNCLHSGIKEIYVLTQFNSESLNNHINSTYRFDYFSRAFVRILAAEQTLDNTNWFQGTADAVRRNLSHLNMTGNEDVLILSGDHLYEMDYRELIHFHRKNNADFTVSVIPVREDEAKDFGIMKLGKSSNIIGFKEKPKKCFDLKKFRMTRGSCLASMGVYAFKTGALIKALKWDDVDFGREVIPHSIKYLRGYGYLFDGYWKDLGTIKSFYDANMELALYKKYFSFFYNGTIFTRPRFLPSAIIIDSRIKSSIITEGCVIKGAQIQNSIIGLRNIVGRNCFITRTVIMGADYYDRASDTADVKIGIGDNTVIDRAIIDKNARIGKNVVIKNIKRLKEFDGDNYFIRDGIVIVPKDAIIKDGTKI